ncbi:MAG: Pyridoxal phosphate homeostasis protein [Legionellaceae bacterium]
MTIQQRLLTLKHEIAQNMKRYSRCVDDIHLIAVSKGQPVNAIKEAYDAGQIAFGENYLQEALIKIEQLRIYPLEWHYIGLIQSNKTKLITEYFDWVHSVSNLKIAKRLSEHRSPNKLPLSICIQVNIDNDPNKAGIPIEQLDELAHAIYPLPHLHLRGLMTIPENISPTHTRHVFRELKNAYTKLQKQGIKLNVLSMGMSQDYEYAIAEGTTHLRIGELIFGRRDKKNSD